MLLLRKSEAAIIDADTSLPRFRAPPAGQLTADMVAAFDAAGVIVLEDFAARDDCDRLRARAHELVEEFDPGPGGRVFSTLSQEQHGDHYFLESGDKIRFFLEADATDEHGNLRRPTVESLNKMGHAMHDLDPVFERFS